MEVSQPWPDVNASCLTADTASGLETVPLPLANPSLVPGRPQLSTVAVPAHTHSCFSTPRPLWPVLLCSSPGCWKGRGEGPRIFLRTPPVTKGWQSQAGAMILTLCTRWAWVAALL